MTPIISILLPVYNGMPYIKKTIESIFSQTLENWELLISDNASTDGTWEYLSQLKDTRISIYAQDKNIGITRNWNFLMKLVNTKYVSVIGADDIYLPIHLKRKIDLLESFPGLTLVHGNVFKIDESGRILNRSFFNFDQIELSQSTAPRLLNLNFINITSVVFSMEAVRKLDLSFEDRYKILFDWALLLKFSILGGVMIFDNQPTLLYRVHKKSTTNTNLNSFTWHIESILLRTDCLMEHASSWEKLNLKVFTTAKNLTNRLWTVALRQLTLGNWINTNSAWNTYRKFHKLRDVIWDLIPYIISRLNKLKLENKKN